MAMSRYYIENVRPDDVGFDARECPRVCVNPSLRGGEGSCCIGALCGDNPLSEYPPAVSCWRKYCPMCGDGVLQPTANWFLRDSTSPVAVLPALDGRWGLLDPSGGVVTPSGVFSPLLSQRLSSDTLRFVSASEPTALRADRNLEGILLARDASAISGFALSGTQGFFLDGELPPLDGPTIASAVSIHLPSGALLSNLAIAALDGPLLINDGVRVQRADGTFAAVASATGEARIGVDAVVGDLTSRGSVSLRNRATVDGTLRTAGTVSSEPDATVTGAIQQLTSLAPYSDETWIVRRPVNSDGDRILQPDETLPLPPGSYGSITINSRAHLQLSTGTYYLAGSLQVEPQAVLDVDNTQGPVYLYVDQGFTFRGAIQESNPSLSGLLITVLGSSPVNIEAPIRASVVAPNTTLVLASVTGGEHTGSFFAKSVEVHQWQTVRYRPFQRPDCARASGCLGGWEAPPGSAPVTRSLGIPARTDYEAVVSSTLDSLFVIGGRFQSSGDLTQQIVSHRLSSGLSQVLGFEGFAPQQVLGATASFVDGSLWILDRAGAVDRLTRLDTERRLAQTVWQGTESGGFTSHRLTTDRDGSVLITSWNGSGYAVLRADALPFTFGSERIRLVLENEGQLVGAPCVVPDGLSFIRRLADMTLLPLPVQPERGTLIVDPGPWL